MAGRRVPFPLPQYLSVYRAPARTTRPAYNTPERRAHTSGGTPRERHDPMELTHFDEAGRARMVDVGAKADTLRQATAAGVVRMRPETLARIREGRVAKGDVLAVAQVAGVMAAKRTPDIIPMCHTLLLTGVDL